MRLLCAAVLALLLLPAAASAQPEQAETRDCFFSRNWEGWSAPRDTNLLYLRVRPDEIYQVELTPGVRVRRYGDEFLVNQTRGSTWICSALDLDLAISDRHGISRPLIVTNLRKLTPEEAAAIPPEDIPN